MLHTKYRTGIIFSFFIIVSCFFTNSYIFADETEQYKKRLALYKKTESITAIPWYYLAAIDQYERNKKIQSEEDKLISIEFTDIEWFGIGNSSLNTDINTIKIFNGIGQDANGDGHADPNDGEDVLFTMALYLADYGFSDEDIKIDRKSTRLNSSHV